MHINTIPSEAESKGLALNTEFVVMQIFYITKYCNLNGK